jgi:hypothetical protein
VSDSYGDSPEATAMRRQLARLAVLEQTELYQDLCRSADRRVLANGGREAAHGWGEYGANGDPRKRRKVAS